MFYKTLAVIATTVILSISSFVCTAGISHDYSSWFKESPLCNTGKHESPIDITESTKADLPLK